MTGQFETPNEEVFTMVTRYSGGSLMSDFVSLRDAMDRLFSESFVPSGSRASIANGSNSAAFPIDVYATDDAMTVLAAVPGSDPSAIDISIEKGQVTIKGEVPDVAASEDARSATWYVHELPRGTFQRTLTVPFEVDAGAAGATFENGMLRLTLPKAETARPRQIKVRGAGENGATGALAGGEAETSES
jgi:HSP20 family protein